ncbi:hypothetical protein [Brevundimonas sp. UBA2416]|mgnify:FL=1|uniref:hypothetical protein n=1 Tax=Brevundimonas sp. UBA2416 TaxID=1946124 RepID=UPI0025C6E2CB|nr:hypothetical protein [Brevundimonas sp. UBA2416]
MIRTLAAAAALATLALAGAASAQTWGQPIYLNAYGRPVGGSPLSEVETRSYVGTGLWADGYSDRPQVYVPAPGYGQGYGYSHGRDRYGHGYGRGHSDHGYRRQDPPSRPAYRDEWGYNDDRSPSSRRWSDDGRSRRRDRDCGCSEVYLYDR